MEIVISKDEKTIILCDLEDSMRKNINRITRTTLKTHVMYAAEKVIRLTNKDNEYKFSYVKNRFGLTGDFMPSTKELAEFYSLLTQ